MSHEPKQKRGKSFQNYSTPWGFIQAVEGRFGKLTYDLAASGENAKAERYFDEADDSLAQDWTKLSGCLWINPTFGNIQPWAEKCMRSAGEGRRILLLTPASVGSNWFGRYVFGSALVLALSPRIRFVGCEDDYPRDLILSVFGRPKGFDIWKWKEGES